MYYNNGATKVTKPEDFFRSIVGSAEYASPTSLNTLYIRFTENNYCSIS